MLHETLRDVYQSSEDFWDINGLVNERCNSVWVVLLGQRTGLFMSEYVFHFHILNEFLADG
jgi:hypothetical protein